MNKYIYIIKGTTNKKDALYFLDHIKSVINNREYKVLENYINSLYCKTNSYDEQSKINIHEIFDIMVDINKCKYQEDTNEIIQTKCNKTLLKYQMNVLMRIINIKPLKSVNTNICVINNKIIKCPHCNHDNINNSDSDYTICGYSNNNNGYDWVGCGKDWCFKCSKILCKNWSDDQLFLQHNRIHTEFCCSQHAKANNLIYPDNYCTCV
jgi:hypothetical protein